MHFLHDVDRFQRTAFCEACGAVDIRRQGGYWRCYNVLNARRSAQRARKRGDRDYARRTLLGLWTTSGIPEATNLRIDHLAITAEQAEWLYWVTRAGVEAIAARSGNGEATGQ